MAWITPKLDWLSTDSINYSDWNRIENNIAEVVNYLNNIQYPIPSDNVSALSFNGTSDYVELGNSINLSTTITLEAWIYLNSYSTSWRSCIFSRRIGSTGWSFVIGGELASNYKKLVFIEGGSGAISSNTILELNTWYHVAVVVNSSSIELYINGALDNSGTTAWTNDNAATICIGKNGDNSLYPFSGIIDDARIWSVASTQIQENMNKELIGNETGLVGYWKFNEGSGAIAYDSTANGNNGTITGATWTSDIPPLYKIITSRDKSYIDFLSGITRIEQNLETIRTHFITPPGYLGTKSWAVGTRFDYTDANRLETNVKLLMDYGLLVYDSLVYCGTINAGYVRGDLVAI